MRQINKRPLTGLIGLICEKPQRRNTSPSQEQEKEINVTRGIR